MERKSTREVIGWFHSNIVWNQYTFSGYMCANCYKDNVNSEDCPLSGMFDHVILLTHTDLPN